MNRTHPVKIFYTFILGNRSGFSKTKKHSHKVIPLMQIIKHWNPREEFC